MDLMYSPYKVLSYTNLFQQVSVCPTESAALECLRRDFLQMMRKRKNRDNYQTTTEYFQPRHNFLRFDR